VYIQNALHAGTSFGAIGIEWFGCAIATDGPKRKAGIETAAGRYLRNLLIA